MNTNSEDTKALQFLTDVFVLFDNQFKIGVDFKGWGKGREVL